ncbi:hypothetical protein Tco_0887456 [Tanacetum coccineum]
MLDYGFNFMNTKIHIDNESTICTVKNPMFHSKTKHIEIRHHFIRDSYEKKLVQVIKIHTDHNVADLLTKAFDVSRELIQVVVPSAKIPYWWVQKLKLGLRLHLNSPMIHLSQELTHLEWGGQHKSNGIDGTLYKTI